MGCDGSGRCTACDETAFCAVRLRAGPSVASWHIPTRSTNTVGGGSRAMDQPMLDVLSDWVHGNAERFSDEPALENVDFGERRTWRQLEDRVGRLAAVLHAMGVARRDRVILIAEGDARTFEVQFACMRLGAALVPLNWRLAHPELVELARDVSPTLTVFDGAWRDTALAVANDVGCELVLGWRAGGSEPDYEEELRGARHMSPTLDLPNDLPALILHTSGTTGRPKGAVITAKTLAWQTLNTVNLCGVTGPGSKQLNQLPLFHAGALCTVAAPLLRMGGCVAVTRRFEPRTAASLLGEPAHGFTHYSVPPTMWTMIAQAPEFEQGDYSSLRYAEVAGAVPSMDLLQTWRRKRVTLQPAYGGTELGPMVTQLPAEQVCDRPTSCGLPVANTVVRIVDEGGRDVGVREVGEIWVDGPSVTPGYWQRDGTLEPMRTDGFFRTGDAAYRDDEGYVYIVDRYKEMYKSGGEIVAPAEVERVIATHPAVQEVAVVAVPDERWGEVGRAFIVVIGGRDLTLQDVAEHCDGRIARYKVPKSVVTLEQLPRNVTGKVMKECLRQGDYGT